MLFIMLLYSEIIGLFFSNSKLQKHLINGKNHRCSPQEEMFSLSGETLFLSFKCKVHQNIFESWELQVLFSLVSIRNPQDRILAS